MGVESVQSNQIQFDYLVLKLRKISTIKYLFWAAKADVQLIVEQYESLNYSRNSVQTSCIYNYGYNLTSCQVLLPKSYGVFSPNNFCSKLDMKYE